MRFLPPLAASLALAPVAPPQEPGCLDPQNLIPLTWQAPPPAAAETFATVGDFDGDGGGEVLAVADGLVHHYPFPALMNVGGEVQVFPSATALDGVTAIATVPEGNSTTGGDGIAITTASGLHVVPKSVQDFFDPLLVSSSTGWQSATRLICAEVNGTFGPDLLAVSPTGDEVVIRYRTTIGFQLEDSITLANLNSAFAPTAAPTEIFDVAVLDWFNDGDNDFVVLTNEGVGILHHDKTPIAWHDYSAAWGVLERIYHPSPAADQMVWARPTASGTPELLIGNGTSPPTGVPLDVYATCVGATAIAPTAMGAFDFDDNGSLDIAITHPGNSVLIFKNQGAAAGFFSTDAGTGYEVFAPDTSGGTIAVGQINEGPEDLVYVTTENIEVYDELPYEIALAPSTPYVADQIFWGSASTTGTVMEYSAQSCGSGSDFGLHLTVHVQQEYTHLNHIEVILWEWISATGTYGPNAYISPTAISRELYDMILNPAVPPSNLQLAASHQFITINDVANLNANSKFAFDSSYFVQLRFVELDGTGNFVRASKWYLGAFSHDNEDNFDTYAELELIGAPGAAAGGAWNVSLVPQILGCPGNNPFPTGAAFFGPINSPQNVPFEPGVIPNPLAFPIPGYSAATFNTGS